jgi:hypothetical protein
MMNAKTEECRDAVAAQVDPTVMQRLGPWGPGQFAVVATFRYCLGRQTYIVQECADWLLLHWSVIEQPVRSLIQRELERAFEQDDKARAGDAQGYKPPGWDCDREQWARVRSLWANASLTALDTAQRTYNEH